MIVRTSVMDRLTHQHITVWPPTKTSNKQFLLERATLKCAPWLDGSIPQPGYPSKSAGSCPYQQRKYECRVQPSYFYHNPRRGFLKMGNLCKSSIHMHNRHMALSWSGCSHSPALHKFLPFPWPGSSLRPSRVFQNILEVPWFSLNQYLVKARRKKRYVWGGGSFVWLCRTLFWIRTIRIWPFCWRYQNMTRHLSLVQDLRILKDSIQQYMCWTPSKFYDSYGPLYQNSYSIFLPALEQVWHFTETSLSHTCFLFSTSLLKCAHAWMYDSMHGRLYVYAWTQKREDCWESLILSGVLLCVGYTCTRTQKREDDAGDSELS